MKIAFYEISPWEVEFIKGKLPNNDLSFFVSPFSETDLPDPSVEILSCFTGSKVTLKLLEKLPHIKFVATRTTGFDHINLDACKARNVKVSNVPTYGANTVAEFTFALLLAVSRKLYPSLKRVKEMGSFNFDGLRGFDLQNKTLGIIGTGHIGAYTIKIAHGFGMKILAYDPKPSEDLAKQYDFTYVTLDDLLRQSDIISLHVPYMPATHHIINMNNIHMIKKGCILLNTARGGLVETQALVQGLRSGVFAGAGLDVLEEELFLQDETQVLLNGHPTEMQIKTVLADHELMHMENVIITPHNAFQTTQAIERILDTTVENIQNYIAGKPINLV
jgi:D-lactate dehydrogenase